ncbi:MAG TPA: PAS domain-containing protein [Ramlibacter sp.]|nr:PAS domain-containing protein [Ramlibacter sp.]
MLTVRSGHPQFLAGGGATGALVRSHHWASTPVGEPDRWPQPLKTLVEMMLASSQPMFVAWGAQRTLVYNDAYAEILGGKHPSAMGRDFLEVWSEIRHDLVPIVERAYGGQPVQMDDIELWMLRKGFREETHFSFFYSPVRDGSGRVAGFFCACNETTAQVMAERRLRASEARLRGVLANMGEGFALLDREFRVLDCNDAALQQDGRPREEVVGRLLWDLHPGIRDAEIGQMYLRIMRERKPESMELHYAWPVDGREAWVEVRAFPVEDGMAVFFRDVTDRRRMLQQAAISAERVQMALDAGAIVGTFVWEVPRNHFIADERFARSFGIDPALCQAGLPLERVMESIHPEDVQRVSGAVSEAMARGGPYRCQYRVRQSDGIYRWIEANGHVQLGRAGEPLRFPGVLLDIEERRRTESERDRATTLLRTIVETVPGVVYAKDREGRMLVANRGTAELIGKPPEDFIGRTDAEFLEDKVQAAQVMANDLRIMESGRPEQIEEAVRLADGADAYWLSSKAPLRNGEGEVIGLVGASIDITERRREQERARTEAEMLDLLNRTGATLASTLELEALLQAVTDAGTQLTGAQFGAFFYNGRNEAGEAYLLYALSGAPRAAFERFGHPRPTPIFEPTFRGGPPIRLDDVTADPRYGRMDPHRGMPAGHLPVRSYLAVSVTARSGEVLGGLLFGHPQAGVFTERSERLASGIAAQAAIAIDNARLYAQAQRAADERTHLLESERAARAEAERASTLKDEFLATLSHELRTPLSAILGWVHILRRKAATGHDVVHKGIDVIERSSKVQLQLIEDLLDMSRITSGKLRMDRQPVAPATFVQAAIDALRPAAAGAGVRLDIDLGRDAALVLGDASRLQQVVWNLLSNAIKFSARGGAVRVRLATLDHCVRIVVSDEGAGIKPEFLPHVFERFRQADGSITRRYGGLGLGLSIVRHLVDLHRGSVTADSAGEGKGATFTVTLPLLGAAGGAGASPLPASAGGSDASLSGLDVLVVDDEPDVMDLLQRVLGDAGATVRGAASAAAALDCIRARRPHVMVSDIGMPGMDGYELMRQVRRLDPAGQPPLKAIALTAFARSEDRRKAIECGYEDHLVKPVDPEVLVMRLAGLAREPGSATAPESRPRA